MQANTANAAPIPSAHDTLLAATAQIVSSYVMQRPHENIDLVELTQRVYATLSGLQLPAQAVTPSCEHTPAVKVDESVKPDYLICLEDGKRVKMLKRYLKTNYNLTPEEYKRRWNLPASYPMVAPNYAKVRSKLAKDIGLGKRGMPASAAQRMAIVAANR